MGIADSLKPATTMGPSPPVRPTGSGGGERDTEVRKSSQGQLDGEEEREQGREGSRHMPGQAPAPPRLRTRWRRD